MIRRYDFAPLDGITKVVFRQVYHRLFGGADRYFIPFFSPTDQHILTKRDQRELDPAANAGLHVVPQVMTRRAPDFLWAAEVRRGWAVGEKKGRKYRSAPPNSRWYTCRNTTLVMPSRGAKSYRWIIPGPSPTPPGGSR